MRTQKRGKSPSLLITTAELIGSTIGKLASKTGIAGTDQKSRAKQTKTKRVASSGTRKSSRTRPRATTNASTHAPRKKRA
jgi:hypothetical protein